MSDPFLSLLYEGSSGFLDVVTKGEESGQPDNQRWFRWPQDEKVIRTYIDLRTEEDVYVAVALYSQKDRQASDLDAVSRVVYADADKCHPSNFRLTPSISVQTSAGRWHCFWVLDNQVSAKDAAAASHRIAKAHVHQGCDKSGWIASKILRVPGTTNLNHGAPERVEATYTGEIYTLAEINKAYSDISLTEISVKSEATPPFSDIEALEVELEKHGQIADLYLQTVPAGGSWSERAYRLEIDLFRAGFNAQDVFTITWHAKCNKYHPDAAGQLTESGVQIPKRANPEDTLWAEVLKAQGEYRTETMTVAVDDEPELADRMQFITDEERKVAEGYRTYVDEFDDWVASRSPQSDVRYRRSAAFMVLSCIFGDKIFLAQRHSNTAPNMWLLTLGITTKGKKTTVHDRAMDVVRAFEEVAGKEIIIANNFSEEALNSALGPRDGQVSLWSKDEIQGFFKAILAKGYMASIKDYLTELFNGRVLVSLRQNKDAAQKKRATTVFNIYGMGIPEQTTNVLTMEDFSSGFMMRFIYAIGDNTGLDVEGLLSQPYEGTDNLAIDPTPTKMAQDFHRLHRRFTRPQTMMVIKGDEMDRIFAWERMMFASVIGDKDQDLLVAGITRLSIQMQKSMILLAASEGREKVNMMDVIQVLRQGEWWFADFIKVLHSVGESEFQTKVREILTHVDSQTDHKINLANLRRKFGKYKPREFDEFMQALTERGQVEISRDGSKTYVRSLR